MTGTFGVQGRVPSKIIKLQQQVASNIAKFFQNKFFKQDLALGKLPMNKDFSDFLQILLQLNPK